MTYFKAPVLVLATLAMATPAWAVTSTSVIITQDQKPVAESRISLFNADTGQAVAVQQDDDSDTALFLLDGGNYRIMVDGKEVERISVTGDGSRTVRIRLPSATGLPGDGSPNPAYIRLLGNYASVEVPQTGIGFFRDGAAGVVPESFAISGPRRIDHFGGTLAARFPVAGVKPIVSFQYDEGRRGPLSFTIAANPAMASGVVYGDLSPGESSGISTSLGLNGSMATRSKRFAVGVDVPLLTGGQSALGIALGYRRWNRTYDGAVNFSSGGNQFAQTRNQKLDESHFAFGLFGDVSAPIGPSLTGHLAARGGGYFRKSDLNSLEANTCSFCPVADRNFTIAIRDDDSDLGMFADFGMALEFALSPKTSVWAGGSGRYLSRVGAVFNPNSGNQVFFNGLKTALTRTDTFNWQADVGIAIKLD